MSARRKRLTPQSAAEWGQVAPLWLGAIGLAACFVVWVATYLASGHGAVEPAFVSAFGALLAAGQAAQAVGSLKKHDDPQADEEDAP